MTEDKLMTIREMCDAYEVTPRTLRFYEQKELLAPIREGQKRLYTKRERARLVLILRGIAQGVPTAHLAQELGIDRTHLLERRHEIQKLIEQRFPPSGTAG